MLGDSDRGIAVERPQGDSDNLLLIESAEGRTTLRAKPDTGTVLLRRERPQVLAALNPFEASGVDRQVVELTYLQDLTSVQVGKVLGLAPSSVRCRLHRLRRTLKCDLASDLVDSERRATA